MNANRIVMVSGALVLALAAVVVVARVGGREESRVISPDGRWVAVVKSHWTVDPPSQSLWLGASRERLTKVETLAEDMDWCSETVWSEDSEAVAYVVNGTRAVIVEPGSPDRRTPVQLVEENDYPSAREARTVRFSEDGDSLVFRDCVRGGSDCRDGQVRIRD